MPPTCTSCPRPPGSSRLRTACSCPRATRPTSPWRARASSWRSSPPFSTFPPAAGIAHPVRRAALEGERGGGASGHERRLGQSALQRVRATLAAADAAPGDPRPPLDDADRELLARYVQAFEQYDMTALTSLIQEDASQSMPPYDMWLRGRDDILSGGSGRGSAVRGRVSSLRPARAARRPSGSTSPIPTAVTSRGRFRCSSSQAGGSSSSRSSLTPTRCSRCSACPPGSIRTRPGQPDEGHQVAEVVGLRRAARPAGPSAARRAGSARARRSRPHRPEAPRRRTARHPRPSLRAARRRPRRSRAGRHGQSARRRQRRRWSAVRTASL